MSTCELMDRFYGHARAGLGKDQALRQAELDLIRGPIVVGREGDASERDASFPFHWAAFQVFGDSR